MRADRVWPGSGRRGIRRRVRRPRALPWRLADDLLALTALAVVLAALLAYVAALPPSALAFPVDRQPPQVIMRNFYGLERNEGGAFRWSKPDASLIVPVNAPATYRITLVLQDTPAARPRRPLTVYVNGLVAGTVVLEDTPREYTFAGRLAPGDWRFDSPRALIVELQTAPFVPPGDPRPLGVIVGRLEVSPAGPSTPWQPVLVRPYLLALPLVYAALRLLRAPTLAVAGALGLLLAACGALALGARETALLLAYLPINQPIWTLGAILFVSPLPLVARAWPSQGSAPAATPDSASPDWTSDGAQVMARGSTAVWSRRSLALVPVVALALGLRLYHSNHLSLWLDEGFTVLYARLPWPAVLGLEGPYDLHPPLYYAVVKLASAVVPEASAGRLVSVIAGTLTVVVVYALALRLTNRSAALCASLVLAVSPLHLWYSQEARMYALAVLLVGVSFLALVAFDQGASPRWAAGYGVAALLAMYVNYSAAYALAPQIFLLALIAKRHGRRALPLLGATLGAVLAALPWMAQAFSSIVSNEGHSRFWFLGVTATGIVHSLQALVGLGYSAAYYWGPVQTPWVRWPAFQGLLLLAVAPAIALGALALARQRSPAPVVLAGLLAGTIGTATMISVISPGYADRTVLYAVLGWAILAGAAPFGGARAPLRGAGLLSVACILVLSVLGVVAIYRGADKERYRDLAAATADAATSGLPILTNYAITETLIDLYQPRALDERHLRLGPRDRPLADLLAESAGDVEALWFAQGWDDGADLRRQLAALGYERLTQQSFPGSLSLELYARPGARLGSAVPIPDSFAAGSAQAPTVGWQLPADGARFAPDGASGDGVAGQRLILTNRGGGARVAQLAVGATAAGLFTLDVAAQAPPNPGLVGASLTCLSTAGVALSTASAGAPPSSGGDWQAIRTAVLCPAATASVRIALRYDGVGEASFRDVRLWAASPRTR